ncbi:hypothetical protein FZ983_31570 [Azospirillum sp. B21]|uniref:S24/S26 family peptidase n=1 Tax=Azospirillum sp. B21 TaxID=2607496 RepID=UPI0011EC3EF9|nr:S24/S26 family peptidase [Azospirillum sp. B21]KAA0572672.1 hypothetical protein FZ983_31570 [Azospirillum sp. B21]
MDDLREVSAREDQPPRVRSYALAGLTFDQAVQVLVAGGCLELSGRHTVTLGEAARKALHFYFDAKRLDLWKNQVRNLRPSEGEELIAALEADLPDVPMPEAGQSEAVLWDVVALEIEQFGGLHAHCVEGGKPPPTITLLLKEPRTLLQGRNGVGKSQLARAVTWCLTGKIPRSLAEPCEPKVNDYAVEPDTPEAESPDEENGDAAERTIGLPVIVPVPGRKELQWLGGKAPLVSTAVTLDLVRRDGTERCRIRRRLVPQRGTYVPRVERIDPDTGSVQAVESVGQALEVSAASLEATGLMMARLPFLRLDGPNALVDAVKVLTGLQPFENLGRRCQRSVLPRLEKAIPDAARKEMARTVTAFTEEAAKLPGYFSLGTPLPADALPPVPDDADEGKACDSALAALDAELNRRDAELRATIRTATGLDVAEADLSALRKAVLAARTALATGAIEAWADFKALKTLSAVDASMIEAARELVAEAVLDAVAFADLATRPDEAARRRLYVVIEEWRQANPSKDGWPPCACPVCRADLDGRTDETLGLPVRDALARAEHDTAAGHLDAETCGRALANRLRAGLAPVLGAALDVHVRPWEALRRGCTKSAQAHLSGDLVPLQADLAAEFVRLAAGLPEAGTADTVELPESLRDGALGKTVRQILATLADAAWCLEAGAQLDGIRTALFGSGAGEGQQVGYLPTRFDALDKALGEDGPVDSARRTLKTLRNHRTEWGTQRAWIARAAAAVPAVRELVDFGERIETQVTTLVDELDAQTQAWTERLYLPVNATAPALAGTRLDGEGMRVQVRRDGVTGDGRDLVNSSGLRTHLFAFTLALIKRIRDDDGGVSLLLLDDPQTLFDEHNQRRVARALGTLPEHDFRPLITTYDQHFAGSLFRQAKGKGIEFLQILPRSTGEGCARIRRHQLHIELVHEDWQRSDHDPTRIRAFCDEARIMIEQGLRDLIWPSPAVVAGSETMQPLMLKLQRLIGRGGPYSNPAFSALMKHQALKDQVFSEAVRWAHHYPAEDLGHTHAKQVGKYLDPLLHSFEQCRGVLDEALSQGPLSLQLAPAAPDADIVPFPERPCRPLRLYQIGRAAAEGGAEVDDGDGVGSDIGVSLVNGQHQLFGVGKALTWMPRLFQAGDVLIVDCKALASGGLALVWDGARKQAEAGWLKPVQGRPGTVILVGDHDTGYAREFDTDVNECHPVVGILFRGARANAGKALEPLDACPRFADVEGTVVIDQGDSAEPLLHKGDSVLVGARVGDPAGVSALASSPVAVRLEGGRRLVKRLGEKPLDAKGRVWVLDNLGIQGNGAVIRFGEDIPDGFAAVPRADSIRPILGYWFSRQT